MNDPKQTPQGAGTPPEPKPKEGNEGGKSFSQEDLDKLASKVRSEEKAKAEKEREKAIAEATAEAERRAKLSQEEREKEMTEQHKKDLDEREQKVKFGENRMDGINKLNELKIPITFIDFVNDLDKDKMHKNIETLHQAWAEELKKAVSEQISGKPPKDPASGTPSDKKDSKKFPGYM